VIEGRGKSQRERHKIITFTTGGTTDTQSQWLMSELEKAGVRVARENVEGTLSREELTLAEAVYARTSLSHGEVTWETNALRDCLYASALPRHLRTSWFDPNAKFGRRPLERRR
jgi:hypothetical protein